LIFVAIIVVAAAVIDVVVAVVIYVVAAAAVPAGVFVREGKEFCLGYFSFALDTKNRNPTFATICTAKHRTALPRLKLPNNATERQRKYGFDVSDILHTYG